MKNETNAMKEQPARLKWLKRFGIAGFMFFFIKGLVWIAILVGVGKCAVQ
jgi:hypothetical protein